MIEITCLTSNSAQTPIIYAKKKKFQNLVDSLLYSVYLNLRMSRLKAETRPIYSFIFLD